MPIVLVDADLRFAIRRLYWLVGDHRRIARGSFASSQGYPRAEILTESVPHSNVQSPQCFSVVLNVGSQSVESSIFTKSFLHRADGICWIVD